MKIGVLNEPYETGGGDLKVYKDYAKTFAEAANRMLAKVGGLPGFKIISCDRVDVGKFFWEYAKLIYSYEEDKPNASAFSDAGAFTDNGGGFGGP